MKTLPPTHADMALSDYLEISPHPLIQQSGASVEIAGQWVSLKVPMDQWSVGLAKTWEQELFFVFAAQGRSRGINSQDYLCLCREVSGCTKKAELSENRSCEFYNRGICVSATALANDLQPLSFGTIGAFNGLSKQRVHQIYAGAQKKVIQAAARDPVLREYYESLGLAPQNMPDPEKLARSIGEILENKKG